MNRKHFLSSAMAFATTTTLPFKEYYRTIEHEKEPAAIIPPYLKKGAVIGITSPAGYITVEEIQPAINLLQSWGFNVRVGDTISKRDFTFGGTDEQRTADLQQMLNDPEINAILCARGGYGAVRIVDNLKWEKFQQKPKWIIGFSDITVLHAHISRNTGIASIHSKMCSGFPEDLVKAEPIQEATVISIKQALTGEQIDYPVTPVIYNRKGKASGRLVGGNLKTIESLAGSDSDIRTNQKILFVEDTGEYLYSIDRMFWNLKRSGKLAQLAGLIIGGFKIKMDESNEDFGKTLYDIVLEKVKEYDYPVCFDFPVGHQKNNFALKCGVEHILEVTDNGCILKDR
ncbi:MAG: LD-carboxypeptidase [Chitinophagaceae bacterium]|nr:LD-carboxypeptidase [Chitinophagaceae bacterium]